jgi:transcriptional regulator with XRE-family HTH domain
VVERGTSGFAARLKKLRGEAGLTQAELAERAGMHPRGIAKLEQGDRPSPSWDTVRALARALGVTCLAFDDGGDLPPPGKEDRDQGGAEQAEGDGPGKTPGRRKRKDGPSDTGSTGTGEQKPRRKGKKP